jgi:FtsH-binding integral membrane protein
MTAAMVISLTIYAFTTKADFTIMGGMFFILGASMLMLAIFCLFVRFYWLHMLYCCLGVILFGLYLVFDTQLIMGGKRYQLEIDDYILGALILYTDIITIFLYLIQILGGGRN